MITKIKSKTTSKKFANVDDKPHLFFGTTEQIAKEVPLKGISGPVTLTDVYPGFFAFSACQEDIGQRWGIIEVSIEALLPDSFVSYNGKEDWIESLKKCGMCRYNMHIPVIAISKVTIYNFLSSGSNKFVNDAIGLTNPMKNTPKKHQALYALNRGLTRWLACKAVSGEEFEKSNTRKATEINQVLQNRNCLELFYMRTENFHSWWKAEGI